MNTTKLSLWAISESQRELNYILEENGGELTPELEGALAINAENLAVKAADYCATISQYGAMEEAIKAEIKRLQGYAHTCAKIQENLKGALRQAQIAFGFDKMEVGTYRLGTRRSTVVVIDDEAEVPNQFIKVATSVDKAAVKTALKGGEVVPGAHLEENVNISIR